MSITVKNRFLRRFLASITKIKQDCLISTYMLSIIFVETSIYIYTSDLIINTFLGSQIAAYSETFWLRLDRRVSSLPSKQCVPAEKN